MKKLLSVICFGILLGGLTSCSVLTDDTYRTETYEFCCCETCCEGFETWDESWERADDEIETIQTKDGVHIKLTRSYHN